MNKWIKRGTVAAFACGAVVLLGTLGADLVATAKMGRVVDVSPRAVAYRSDAAGVQRGRYLYASRGCGDCHEKNGSGRVVIDDGKGFFVQAPNISPGPGSAVAAYSPADWNRAIRHGVKPDGRPLMVMPSEDYSRLTDEDLAALVAYVRQLPAVAGSAARVTLPLPVKVVYAVGLMNDAAAKIDHALPPPQPVPEAVTPEHGAYVAHGCQGCHGEHLSGGTIPGAPPDWPAASNLTPGEGSALARYADVHAFAAMLRTGKRPDGSAVSQVMPFNALKEISDTDVAALHLYLNSLPPRAAGKR